jgi:hypothetical protein
VKIQILRRINTNMDIPTEIASDERFKPQQIKESWCLNTNQSAKYLDLTEAGWIRKAKRLKVERIKTPWKEKEAFYRIADLVAVRNGSWMIPE